MKTTILGGILFLAPLAILMILLGKVYQMGLAVVQPINEVMPVETVAGIALVNILAVLVILIVCYIAGHLAQRKRIAARLQGIDDLLTDSIPGYAVFKGTVGSVSKDETAGHLLKAVLVRFDDYEQIAFEVERQGARSVVFLPGAPSVWAGGSVIVDANRVSYLNLPTYQAMRLLRVFGRGSLKVRGESADPHRDRKA